MTKTIKPAIDKAFGNIAAQGIDPEWLALVRIELLKEIGAIISERVIGGGELHMIHTCPEDSIPCREFHARWEQREKQRQALITALYGKDSNG